MVRCFQSACLVAEVMVCVFRVSMRLVSICNKKIVISSSVLFCR